MQIAARERPILFSAPMVRALLDGRKTMTRRIVKPQSRIVVHDNGQALTDRGWLPELDNPYGNVGDRLWVRETFDAPPGSDNPGEVVYRADYDHREPQHTWQPSIFMPRWASRLTLEIESVRVERLQDISEADAHAEGVSIIGPDGDHFEDYRDGFAWLWGKINGPGSWDKNPWVWAISFRRLLCK